jgi:fructose/tagatose bisphosphate aldolase
MIDAIYQYITDNREEYDPGKIDQAVKEAIKKTVFNWIEWFGCSGKA